MKQQMHGGKCKEPGVVKREKGAWSEVEIGEFEKVVQKHAVWGLCDK